MINIAICDDSREDSEEIKRGVAEIWHEHVSIHTFASGKDLISDAQKREYHLIFLDIFLENETGIEIAEKLRAAGFAEDIVLISTSKEFGPEAFEINALYYLVKPLNREKLREVKVRLDDKRRDQMTVRIRVNGREQDLRFSLISYIESEHNNLHIYLKNGSMVSIRGSLYDFEQSLDSRFLKLNRGIIVNMEAIEEMDNENCEVAGCKFPMSRSRRMECRQAYTDYLFNLTAGRDKRRC